MKTLEQIRAEEKQKIILETEAIAVKAVLSIDNKIADRNRWIAERVRQITELEKLLVELSLAMKAENINSIKEAIKLIDKVGVTV